jgi:hypothetical protein
LQDIQVEVEGVSIQSTFFNGHHPSVGASGSDLKPSNPPGVLRRAVCLLWRLVRPVVLLQCAYGMELSKSNFVGDTLVSPMGKSTERTIDTV